MKFEWDENKNRINYAKHGVSFEVASKVFNDPLAAYIFDRIVDGEERWHAVGKIDNLPLIVVVHTYRNENNEEIIRIISARKATQHERRQYENS
ncbi:MAG: BrnT family toxin [Lachnospiraceae bacterium]|nr:BrnT family toxin [Lachnospiraceae bacterium]